MSDDFDDDMDDICCGLRVGQTVPDFTLETYEPATGQFGEVSLDDLTEEGKWVVLVFYPADFTFVCATEFEALAERHEEFKKLGAELITISTDTKFVHLAWQQHEKSLTNVKYIMGADHTAYVSKLFGVYNDSNGLDLRGTFIISPDGTLMNSEINFYNLGRNFDEVLRKLKANTYLLQHDGEACPAKWQQAGDKTLKPSADLVGKVFEALH
ncbi:peroxiredoxin [Candidatus Magnetobacterium bavaricum]|uniref:Alkyl hydroperoxide reductase C n=1 Tax=Candidatus Magnetobacterium bavaricum TaxID=29290 RepID=A0A0F3GZF7_9BACT|nr:peroxiredoxin [Candidatus Magnetobacterium bavaricum]